MNTAGAILDPVGRTECDRLMLLVVHDLRTPTRHSLIRAQLLQRSADGTLNAASETHLAALMEANRLANKLLTRISEFCHAGSGSGLLPPARVEVLVRGAKQALGADKEVTVEITDPHACPVPASLQKAFFELLDNAWKFRKRDSDSCQVAIDVARKGSEIVFEVGDGGIGFDPKYSDLIWEPFRKLHSAGDYPGSGLGLAIVQRIVHASNGRTWATSVPGHGSTFGFAIPQY